MTTDTPRTDAAIWRLTTFSSALLEHDGETCNEIHCASHDEAECLVDLLNERERELAASQAEVERLTEALDTLTAVIGLTPIAGNRDALQEAFDLARKALKPTEK